MKLRLGAGAPAIAVKAVAVPLLLAAVVFGGLMPSSAVAKSLDTSPVVDQILQQGMQAGSGGSDGYYLKQVNGPLLLALNDGLVYDPASALKTLYLAYAMRQVANGADALANPVTAYLYPNSRNAGGNPANKDLCPDPADEVPGNVVSPSPTLQEILSGMMQLSNNRFTRAVELRYGRGNLQAFASSLGMANTRLSQIFGCGADGGVQNFWTLADAGRLYEAIATGNAVPAASTDTLYGLMLSRRGSDYLNIINSEASALGIPDAASPFAAAMVVRLKGGSYNICHGSCGADDVVTRDEAGVMTLPFQNPKGAVPTDFVWGSFIANVQMSCSSFPCAAANQASAAVETSLPELFRPAIRTALQSWAALTTLAADAATYRLNKLYVSARLTTQYGGKAAAGQTIQFSVGGRPLCGAVTDANGVATCSGSARGDASAYTATFAGGNDLFPATATAFVPSLLVTMSVNVKRAGKGVVTSSPAGINCGTKCKFIFRLKPTGVVVLVANPGKGMKVKWSGACSGSRPSCRLSPRKLALVSVTFSKKERALSRAAFSPDSATQPARRAT